MRKQFLATDKAPPPPHHTLKKKCGEVSPVCVDMPSSQSWFFISPGNNGHANQYPGEFNHIPGYYLF